MNNQRCEYEMTEGRPIIAPCMHKGTGFSHKQDTSCVQNWFMSHFFQRTISLSVAQGKAAAEFLRR